MSNTSIAKENFTSIASDFFNEIFEPAFNSGCGGIEIRTFPKGQAPQQYFFESETEAAEKAYQLGQQGIDVYFGVNPRIGNGGKKENVQYLSAFHAEIDYGILGHKKPPLHKTYEEALNVIQAFSLEPTVINHSGGGFHCYWVLSNPVKVSEIGIPVLENINKALSLKLGGDPGTHNIDRVLRVPGTFNFKSPDNPRPVTLISNTHKRYAYEDFQSFIEAAAMDTKMNEFLKDAEIKPITQSEPSLIDIDQMPISDRIKFLIMNGKDRTYVSRSEADMAVISALVNKGVSETDIKQIFQTEAIGEKYRSHPSPDQYLSHSIKKAKELSNLTEEEMQNPLFISGAIVKNDKGYHLDILNFQEYMVKKYQLSIFESNFFRYNGKCYETCPDDDLNCLCQKELSTHRKLFTKGLLKDFVHYAKGEAMVNNTKVREDQVNFLTLQNGLYSLKEERLISHTPKIFTTNLLPYNYDPNAQCPRFIQYLNEIFMDNKEVINFIQQAVGYGFHKSIPMPAIFFLTGNGSNGKSVFINTITNLYGEENTCSISFNALSNEYYLLGLYGKMINISSETPQKRQINTDMIKAVVAGDWVTGRIPYKQPMKFKPYAKHYLAMNEIPVIEDTSHGMWRRIYIVEFPRTFSKNEMDVDLTDKLTRELSGIFNWAMDGYKSLQSKNFRFEESDSMETSKQKYKNDSNNVLSFATEYLKKLNLNDDKVKFSDAYSRYKYYCATEEIKNCYGKKAFRKILNNAGYTIGSSTKDNNQTFIFGVTMITPE
jgi:P4 family phage/plasmid primase-like protien